MRGRGGRGVCPPCCVLSLIPSSGAQTHGARACPRACALVHAAWNPWPELLPFTLWVSAYCLLGRPSPAPFLAPAPALCAHLLLVCPVSPVGLGVEETPESTCAMWPRYTREVVCWMRGRRDCASPSARSPQGYQLCLQTRKTRLLGVMNSRPHGYQCQSCRVCSGHLPPPSRPLPTSRAMARVLHLPGQGAPSG